jgi:hypothetical protein
MRKLILILLAFLAVFTYIRAFERAEASANSTEIPADFNQEISVEIIH